MSEPISLQILFYYFLFFNKKIPNNQWFIYYLDSIKMFLENHEIIPVLYQRRVLDQPITSSNFHENLSYTVFIAYLLCCTKQVCET